MKCRTTSAAGGLGTHWGPTCSALAGLRHVLAVDGFDVLSVHEDDVALDHRLLAQQFGLGGGHDA